MEDRSQHRQHVLAFLRDNISPGRWELARPPSGRGHESYIARSGGTSYFIKLGAETGRYQASASLGLTPAVIMTGRLNDGPSILVQSHVTGRMPSWSDFQNHLEGFANVTGQIHHSPAVKQALPDKADSRYRPAGQAAMARVLEKWQQYRSQVPAVAGYLDDMLAYLGAEISRFDGAGLVASHNDMCNGNWLIAGDGTIYLLDLDAMSLDDPAHDLGSLLWWYYPPGLRAQFLEVAGYRYEEPFRNRMRVRMALHCLDILLPRPNSFDRFDAGAFADNLVDFKSVVAGNENPRGYDD